VSITADAPTLAKRIILDMVASRINAIIPTAIPAMREGMKCSCQMVLSFFRNDYNDISG